MTGVQTCALPISFATRALTMHKKILSFAFLLLLFPRCETNLEKKNNIKNGKQIVAPPKESNVSKSGTSVITCPKCGHIENEMLPAEVCVIKYNCKKCETELKPKKDDCCVFCSYGSHKCPSKQDE